MKLKTIASGLQRKAEISEISKQRKENLVASYSAIYGSDFHRSEDKGNNSIDNLTWCN